MVEIQLSKKQHERVREAHKATAEAEREFLRRRDALQTVAELVFDAHGVESDAAQIDMERGVILVPEDSKSPEEGPVEPPVADSAPEEAPVQA